MKMNHKELVKALQCCAEGDCWCCRLHNDAQRCQETLLGSAAELIEHDQREIAELKAKVEQYRALIPSWVIPMTPKEDNHDA